MRLLGEHAHNRFTRPHLRGHREGRDWSTCFRTDGLTVRDGTLRLSARDQDAGLGLTARAREPPWRWAAGPVHGHQPRLRQLLARRASRWSCPCPTTSPRCWTSPVATSVSARRSVTRSTDGLWLREARGGRPGLDAATMLRRSARRGSRPPRARCSACTSAGAGTRCCASSATRPPAPRSAAASCSSPARSCWVRARRYTTPWVVCRSGGRRPGRAGRVVARLAALPADPPGAANRSSSTSGRRCSSTTTSTGCAGSRTAPPGSVSSGSSSTTAGSGTAATTPPGSATGGSTSRCGPTAWTRWSSTCAASGMEFGLWFEPEMVNPDSDLFRAHPDWVLSTGEPAADPGAPPARPRPDPSRGARLPASTG